MHSLRMLCAVTMLAVCVSTHAQTKADWTVLVWMNGDNNLQDEIVGDWHAMTRVAPSDRVNIVVQIDLFEPNGTWRFKVKSTKKPELDPRTDIGEKNMVSGKELTEFIVWGMQKYPANRYALIFSSHGSGPRDFFSSGPNVISSVPASRAAGGPKTKKTKKTKTRVKITLPDGVFGSPNRAISADDHSPGDALYNREIAEALQAALPSGGKLSLIGFDACLMSMVELAYGVRRSGNVFVASEELINAVGWDYEDWLTKLVSDPTMDETKLGKVLVDSYANAQVKRKDEAVRTLAAVNLAPANDLGNAVSALGDALIAGGNAQMTVAASARSLCLIFAPEKCNPLLCFHHIDLKRFADLIARGPHVSPPVKSAAERVSSLLASMSLANYAGTARRGDNLTEPAFGSHGLAIYFPESGKDFREDALTGKAYIRGGTTESPIEFVEALHWSDFLQAYYATPRGKP